MGCPDLLEEIEKPRELLLGRPARLFPVLREHQAVRGRKVRLKVAHFGGAEVS